MRNKILILCFASIFVLSACTPGDIKDPADVEDRNGSQQDGDQQDGSQAGDSQDGASTSALPGAGQFEGHPLDNPSSPLATRTIYFEFNSSEIKSEFQESILAHGSYLGENPNATVTLEGHTDERGSREYNVGLGERRAQSVRRLLLFQGAVDRQVEVISYGEEKPAREGHEEVDYTENRRVEFIYKR